MAYGTVKVDNITYTNAGSDTTVTVSGLADGTAYSNLSVTGTISGATITGNTGQFTTVTAVTGIFTNTLSGQTVTGDAANFTTVTGGTAEFTTITGDTAGFTTVTGATVTGTTANFVTVSGTTVTGDLVQATTGVFVTASGESFVAGGVTFVSGSGDVRPRGLFSFPTTVGTDGFVLQTNGNGTTSWVAQSGGGGGSITTIMQSKIVIDVNFGISSGFNGLSQGPVEIQSGFTVDVPDGSRWAVLV